MAEEAEPARIRPTKVTIGSALKLFSLNTGVSSGSELTVEFEVPDGLDRPALKRQLLQEKLNLDRTVLAMEYARGAVDGSDYKAMNDRLTNKYAQILKGTPEA